jgi:hypothetical protein
LSTAKCQVYSQDTRRHRACGRRNVGHRWPAPKNTNTNTIQNTIHIRIIQNTRPPLVYFLPWQQQPPAPAPAVAQIIQNNTKSSLLYYVLYVLIVLCNVLCNMYFVFPIHVPVYALRTTLDVRAARTFYAAHCHFLLFARPQIHSPPPLGQTASSAQVHAQQSPTHPIPSRCPRCNDRRTHGTCHMCSASALRRTSARVCVCAICDPHHTVLRRARVPAG